MAQAQPGSPWYGVYATSWQRQEGHFPLVWNWESRAVHGVEVTERYLELARAQGAMQAIDDAAAVLRVEALQDGRRVATAVTVFDADEKLVLQGVTPSPESDVREYFEVYVPELGSYTVVLALGDGEELTQQVELSGDELLRLEVSD